jgi:hypothetical protein
VIGGERPRSLFGRGNPSGPGEPDLEVQLLERIREEVPVVLGPLGCQAELGASAALAINGVLRFPERSPQASSLGVQPVGALLCLREALEQLVPF